tara:strand:- start:449 stop:1066 length:618 start_codon:yes stop_codon:yes gene_type:complete
LKSSDFINNLGRCSNTELKNFKELCELLEKELDRKVTKIRRNHINGVREACKFLGGRFKCNIQYLEVAALLHDLAREMPSVQQIEILQNSNTNVDEIIKKNPVLAHSKVAFVLAQKKYKLPLEVAEIVSYHTTGKAKMNLEECLFFVADALEPGRPWSSWSRLEEATLDLKQTLISCLQWKLDYTLKRGKMIHFHSLECWNWLCD